jgi:hypothetical protein
MCASTQVRWPPKQRNMATHHVSFHPPASKTVVTRQDMLPARNVVAGIQQIGKNAGKATYPPGPRPVCDNSSVNQWPPRQPTMGNRRRHAQNVPAAKKIVLSQASLPARTTVAGFQLSNTVPHCPPLTQDIKRTKNYVAWPAPCPTMAIRQVAMGSVDNRKEQTIFPRRKANKERKCDQARSWWVLVADEEPQVPDEGPTADWAPSGGSKGFDSVFPWSVMNVLA